VFVRFVVADGTADRRANEAMMTGNVPGNTADHSALDAAFGLGRRDRGCQNKRQCGATEKNFHRQTGSMLRLFQSFSSAFVPRR
jgi:hypothetical protein